MPIAVGIVVGLLGAVAATRVIESFLFETAPTDPATFAAVAIGLGVAGIGLGLSQAGLQTAVFESVARHQSGSASGIFSTSRYIGSIAGASALPVLYGVGDEIAGFMRVLSMVAITALAATIASLWIQHRPSPD